MKTLSPFAKVAIINTIVMIGVFCVLFLDNKNDAFVGGGLIALLLCIFELIVGIIVAIASKPETLAIKYGQALMLVSIFLLLCSLTLCSQGNLYMH